MKRKLVKQTSAYVVTLPAKWIKAKNLKGGEEIDIEDIGGRLLIGVEAKKSERTADITIDNDDPFLLRIPMISSYCHGFNRVNINFAQPSLSKRIKEEIGKHVLGFEIVREEPNLIVMDSVVEDSEERYESFMVRSFFIMLELFDILTKDIRKGALSQKDEVIQHVSKIEQYSNYLKRNLYIKRYENPGMQSSINIIMKLNELAKVFRNIYNYVQPRIHADEMLAKYMDSARDMFNSIRAEFSSGKYIPLKKSFAEAKRKEYFELTGMLKGNNSLLTYYCCDITQTVHDVFQAVQEELIVGEK